MLAAMLLFVQQGAMIALSQALASIGVMHDPAVALSGPAHFHNGLAGHVHAHGGKNAVGHVHDAVDTDDDDDVNGADHAPIWELWLYNGRHSADGSAGSRIQGPVRRPVPPRKWRGCRARRNATTAEYPQHGLGAGDPPAAPRWCAPLGHSMLLRRLCLPTSFRTVRVYRANARAAASQYHACCSGRPRARHPRRWVTTSNRPSALCSRSGPLRGVVDKSALLGVPSR